MNTILSSKLTQSIRAIAHSRQKSVGKDLALFVGPTGTGKSTAINYLLGCTMKEARLPNQPKTKRVDVDGVPIARIGHSVVESETLLTEIYTDTSTSRIFCDCGGFLDSRGAENELLVSASIKATLKAARSFKLVICVSYNAITQDRASSMLSTLSTIFNRMLPHYQQHMDSILLLVTKVEDENGHVTTNSVREELEYYCQQHIGTNKTLLEFITRQNGRFIYVCDPLNPLEREELRNALFSLNNISTQTTEIRHSYSPDVAAMILENTNKILQIGQTMKSKIISLQHALHHLDSAIASQLEAKHLLSQCAPLDEKFKRLTSADIGPNRDSAIAQAIDQQTQHLHTLSSRSKNASSSKARLQAQIADLDQKINLLNSTQEEAVYSDSVHRTARSREIPRKVTRYRKIEMPGQLGYALTPFGLALVQIGGGTRREAYQDVEYSTVSERQSYEFSFRDPSIQISAVRKNKGGQTDWVHHSEHRGPTSYRIECESDGKLEADVAVYAQKKDLPRTQQERYRLTEQRQKLLLELQQVDRCIAEETLLAQSVLKTRDELMEIRAKNAEIVEKTRQIEAEIQQLRATSTTTQDELHSVMLQHEHLLPDIQAIEAFRELLVA